MFFIGLWKLCYENDYLKLKSSQELTLGSNVWEECLGMNSAIASKIREYHTDSWFHITDISLCGVGWLTLIESSDTANV